MKILFFSRLFYPHIGGVEKHVEAISKILLKRGHEVTVLTEKFDKSLQDNEVINGIKIKRIENGKDDWFKKFRVWANIWENRESIIDADIIHVHDVFFWFLPFRFLYPNKKVFTTFHGYEGNKIPGFRAKLMHEIAEKLSNGNICVGDFLKKWYGTKPTYITYGGVEINKSQKSKVKSKNFNSKFKILFLGRLEEETGIMEYLRSIILLKNEYSKFELTVLGDGSLMAKARKLASDNKIHVRFEGFQKNIKKYLRKCDFVFTSRYLGILESFVYKKFVFAVYNNEIKKDYLEMAPFAKFISISKNSKELSGKIEWYFKNEQKRSEMIEGGFNWVKNQTWKKMVFMHVDLWNQQ